MKKTNRAVRLSSFSTFLPPLIKIVVMCAILLSIPARANTLSWSGTTSGYWNDSANWGYAGTPANGDTLIFSASQPNLLNTNNIANLTLNQIRFAGPGGGYDIRGNAFTLTNSITATNTAGANTIENNITFTNFNVTILVSNSVSLTLAGSLGGSSTVTKNGLGTLTYSGSTANTYTNLTTVNEGELDLAKSGVQAIAPWGAGLVIGDGSGTDTVRYMGGYQIFSVVTPITITSSGVLDLNGCSDTASPFTLNGGQITTGTGGLTI
jgi:autotransporter-associated beta strand protein